MTAKCHICKRDLSVPGDPTSEDCGGDCLSCMAEAGDPDCIEAMKKIRRQALADAYGAGQIKQALLVGEYPPPVIEGTRTGRFSSTTGNFEDVSPTGRTRRAPKDFWPLAYTSGPTKLSDLQHVTPEQARAASKALLGADFSELERRVAAWHAETVENLKAQGYEPAGGGPLADTWIKKET